MKEIRVLMLFIICAVFIIAGHNTLYGQAERRFIREGNKLYEKERFDESELSYRKALEKDENSPHARFNLGNSLYKQERYDESQMFYGDLTDDIEDPESRSKVFHNLGNSLLKSGQIEQSIEAYKEALRNKPDDQETRYNLALARSLLEESEDQQQDEGEDQDQDQDQNQDEEQNQEQNQDQNQDQDQDQDQNRDQNQDQDQDQEQNRDQNQDQEQEQDQQSRPDQISQEDALRMLEAAEREEQRVQEKLMEKKASGEPLRSGKNW